MAAECWAAGLNFLKNKLLRFSRRRIKRLAAEDPIVAVPVVVVEPVPVLDPTVIVPVDVGDVLGVVGVPLIMQSAFLATAL